MKVCASHLKHLPCEWGDEMFPCAITEDPTIKVVVDMYKDGEIHSARAYAIIIDRLVNAN
ncbi:hypothetical protein SEA_KEELAN_3 [Gordonia phage Keelan]|nr:hypothetical protein SEA_KEELAN_3 [Gordonia phage Keelan]